MSTIVDFEREIDSLDIELFRFIHSESKPGDRTSWLALQRVVRKARGSYVYLEIGSHLGGSIQPYLLDRSCRRIFSIDKRPIEMPDDRGVQLRYEGNSTQRMLAKLEAIDATQINKIVCFDSDARNLNPALVTEPPDLCFIDGEHTEEAVLSDFEFCRNVASPDAVIYFHDDRIIAPALARILRSLDRQSVSHAALKLQESTFAIAFGSAVSLIGSLSPLGEPAWPAIRRMQMVLVAKRVLPPALVPAARRLKRAFWG